MNLRLLSIFVALILVCQGVSGSNDRITSSTPPFSSSELQTMFTYFRNNLDIQGLGGVVASPDTDTPGGTYYYHWERDGALSTSALQRVSNFSYYQPLMKSYVSWVLNVQSEPSPNGIDVRVEPKYFLPYGQVYNGSWCRPQTDGPGLRAMSLIKFANALMKDGQSDYISNYLWTGNGNYKGGAIKYDLDWVASNWPANGCDLWEEITSTDFFWNRYTMKAALFIGAQFAAKMGDSVSSATYQQAAIAVNNTLAAHYNGQFVYESTNREKDSAVVLAFNEGYTDDGNFAPTDPRVTGTINTLNSLFNSEYPINSKDTQNGIPGILWGRYQGDNYAGGNPWILNTCGLAELLYRGATATLKENALPVYHSLKDWKEIFSLLIHRDHEVSELQRMSPLEFSQLVTLTGDAVLQRIRYHVEGAGFHLSEQLDKNTGYEIAATDLTWSYANLLQAMWYRNQMSSFALKHYPSEVKARSEFYSMPQW